MVSFFFVFLFLVRIFGISGVYYGDFVSDSKKVFLSAFSVCGTGFGDGDYQYDRFFGALNSDFAFDVELLLFTHVLGERLANAGEKFFDAVGEKDFVGRED